MPEKLLSRAWVRSSSSAGAALRASARRPPRPPPRPPPWRAARRWCGSCSGRPRRGVVRIDAGTGARAVVALALPQQLALEADRGLRGVLLEDPPVDTAIVAVGEQDIVLQEDALAIAAEGVLHDLDGDVVVVDGGREVQDQRVVGKGAGIDVDAAPPGVDELVLAVAKLAPPRQVFLRVRQDHLGRVLVWPGDMHHCKRRILEVLAGGHHEALPGREERLVPGHRQRQVLAVGLVALSLLRPGSAVVRVLVDEAEALRALREQPLRCRDAGQEPQAHLAVRLLRDRNARVERRPGVRALVRLEVGPGGRERHAGDALRGKHALPGARVALTGDHVDAVRATRIEACAVSRGGGCRTEQRRQPQKCGGQRRAANVPDRHRYRSHK